MTTRELAAATRATQLRASIARFRLVFVQFGTAFEPLRELTLQQLRGTVVSARSLVQDGLNSSASGIVVVTDLEACLVTTDSGSPSLGALRDVVMREMDSDAVTNFCLVSRAPRVAYSTIPGSSVLEDSSLFSIPLLEDLECPEHRRDESGWRIPAATFSDGYEFSELMTLCLRELGTRVLSAVDHALFEVDPRSADALKFLSHRDLEALKGAGLVIVDDSKKVTLVGERRLAELRNALSDLMSDDSAPPQELGQVTSGLWYIERTIRAALRRSAIANSGEKWRGAVLSGGLSAEVLTRARLDSSPSAASVKELRDPIEWLTMGELMSLVASGTHKNLGVDPIIWRRFNEQLVPIRNRISHMRYLKSGDEEAVSMWVGVIKQQLDR